MAMIGTGPAEGTPGAGSSNPGSGSAIGPGESRPGWSLGGGFGFGGAWTTGFGMTGATGGGAIATLTGFGAGGPKICKVPAPAASTTTKPAQNKPRPRQPTNRRGGAIRPLT
jgi:hypothetical protein